MSTIRVEIEVSSGQRLEADLVKRRVRENTRPASCLWDRAIDIGFSKPMLIRSRFSRVTDRAAMGCLVLLGLATAIMIGWGVEEEIRFSENLSAVRQRAERLGGGASNGRRAFRRYVGVWFHGEHITNESMPEIVAIVRECQSRGLDGTNLSLYLSRTGVDDEGVKLLHNISGLNSVWLDDTKVTRDGVRSLQRARPSTSVYPRPTP